jgi:hypothetical protein
MLGRGADPDRIDVFADTVDVGVRRTAARLEGDATTRARASRSATSPSVGRAVLLEGLDTLIRTIAMTGVRGSSCSSRARRARRERANALARRRIRLVLLPRGWGRLERYSGTSSLLSAHEPWGVVVSRRRRPGSARPRIASAPRTTFSSGVNGVLVPPATTGRRHRDPRPRATGAAPRDGSRLARARAVVGYEPSVETLLGVVRRIVGRTGGAD